MANSHVDQSQVPANAVAQPARTNEQMIADLTRTSLSRTPPWLKSCHPNDAAKLISKLKWALKWANDRNLNRSPHWKIGSNQADDRSPDPYASNVNPYNPEQRPPYRLWSKPENFARLKSCSNCFKTRLVLSEEASNTEVCFYWSLATSRQYPNGRGWDEHKWGDVKADFWDTAILAPAKDDSNPKCAVFVFDCEMMEVLNSSEIITFSAVDGISNEILEGLNCIVRPRGYVPGKETGVDFLKKYTGFNGALMDLAIDQGKCITIGELRERICSVIDQETIVVGWGIAHDLRCLGLAHSRTLDLVTYDRIQVCQPGERSLKHVALEKLGIQVQNGVHGSLEDALVTAELLRFYMRGQPETEHSKLRRIRVFTESDGEKSVSDSDDEIVDAEATKEQVKIDKKAAKNKTRKRKWTIKQKAKKANMNEGNTLNEKADAGDEDCEDGHADNAQQQATAATTAKEGEAENEDVQHPPPGHIVYKF